VVDEIGNRVIIHKQDAIASIHVADSL